MSVLEQRAISEVSRVVDNYNSIIEESPSYDGSGRIELSHTSEPPADLIDSVLISMQQQKLAFEKAGESDIASEIDACVSQVHDAKKLLN